VFSTGTWFIRLSTVYTVKFSQSDSSENIDYAITAHGWFVVFLIFFFSAFVPTVTSKHTHDFLPERRARVRTNGPLQSLEGNIRESKNGRTYYCCTRTCVYVEVHISTHTLPSQSGVHGNGSNATLAINIVRHLLWTKTYNIIYIYEV